MKRTFAERETEGTSGRFF